MPARPGLGIIAFLLTALLSAACGPVRGHPSRALAPEPSQSSQRSPSSAPAPPSLNPSALPQAVLQAPAPGSLQLADLQLVTPSLGWAVGSRCAGSPAHCTGAVLATTDGGGMWTALPAPPAALDGVQFLNASRGWVWGPDGAWATADGGRTWSALAVPTRSVSFLDFVDSAHGWLGAFGGGCAMQGCGAAVYETSDGGSTWRRVAVNAGPGPAPSGVQPNLPWAVFRTGGGLSSSRGWLFASDPGAIYVTADGGARWQRTILKSGASAVAFRGTSSGWVATEGCIPAPCAGPHANNLADLYHSTDGGRSWTWAAPLPGFPTELSAVPGGASVWVLDQPADGTVYCDDRSCGTQVAVVRPGAAPDFHALQGFALLRVQGQTATSAWAVGSIRAPGDALLHTTDGGKSWAVGYEANTGYRPGRLWGFWTPDTGWALGASTNATAVLHTDDGGRTWLRVGTLPQAVGTGGHGGFVTPKWGWALTDQGELLSSTDGGAHWADVGIPKPCGTIENMGFVDPEDGWILADGGACSAPTLYRSSDGGRSWTVVSDSAGTPIAQVTFATAREGWGRVWLTPRVGGPSELARTEDGGRTWQPVATLDPKAGLSVSALDAVSGGVWVTALRKSDSAWVAFEVSTAGVVSGGFAVPRQDRTSAFQFLSARVGWVQADGILFATSDGGTRFRALA